MQQLRTDVVQIPQLEAPSVSPRMDALSVRAVEEKNPAASDDAAHRVP
ncbi:hypothetical protein [Paenibacillus taiwanensis]|nr:hypothetical protein [Paenibacillus taiwanensis]